MTPQEFFSRALPAAIAGGHIWPDYAAAEAAEESRWGTSRLAIAANNLLGLKQGRCTAGYPTIVMPTEEWIGGKLVPAQATWPRFASWAEAFSVRMQLLRELAGEIPDYAAALAAQDGSHFVLAVSRKWSSDPKRALNVLTIHADHAFLLSRLLDAARAKTGVVVGGDPPPTPTDGGEAA